jgi:RimJ/RimL family protein N-acetyltransferase
VCRGPWYDGDMRTLQTERLVLRAFREADLAAYARICADPDVVRHVGQPFSRAEAWLHIAVMLRHWQLRGCGMWAVEDRSSGALIGRIGFYEPEGWPGLELGWMLATSHWGRGLATEGARAALAFAFGVLERPHIISLIRPENAVSVRVAEKLGEAFEGRSRALGVEALVYGIRREEWGGAEPGAVADGGSIRLLHDSQSRRGCPGLRSVRVRARRWARPHSSVW